MPHRSERCSRAPARDVNPGALREAEGTNGRCESSRQRRSSSRVVNDAGLRSAVFETRDAAGRGGSIKTITRRLSPRVVRVAALGGPTEREKSPLYIPLLPVAKLRARLQRPPRGSASSHHRVAAALDATRSHFSGIDPMYQPRFHGPSRRTQPQRCPQSHHDPRAR